MCTLLSLINSTYGVHARSKSDFAVINYHPVNTLKKECAGCKWGKTRKIEFPSSGLERESFEFLDGNKRTLYAAWARGVSSISREPPAGPNMGFASFMPYMNAEVHALTCGSIYVVSSRVIPLWSDQNFWVITAHVQIIARRRQLCNMGKHIHNFINTLLYRPSEGN